MKRYNCTSSDKRGAFGLCMEEHKEGAFVPFSEVSGLAEQLADATRQCGVMADLLREARSPLIFAMEESSEDKSVAIEELIDSIDSVLAGKVLERIGSNALAMMMDELHDICVGLDAPGGAQNGAEAWEQVKEARDRVLASLNQGRPDTEWTDAATSPASTDYRELQEQHDQLQSRLKGALDLLHELREGAEIHLHNCKVCKNEDGVNNWTGKLARIDSVLAGKILHPAVTVTETIRTAPERIWLQVGDQSHYHSEPFPEHHDEVTWCADSVVAFEVPYVRADLAGKVPEQHKTNWPDKCPITRRDFFMEIDGVPTYGGPYDSYTIPEMLGTPEQPWHERELFVRRFDHDEGRWVDDEVISQRVIHDGVLDELLDLKEQQADQSGVAPQGGEPCAIEPRSSSQA